MDIENLKLEEALEKLSAIADAMENAELPLTDLMALYKEGIALSKHCEALLDSAEKEIEILEREEAEHEA